MKIAVIEDDSGDCSSLLRHLRRYEDAAEDRSFEIQEFSDGADFMVSFRPVYDLIFLDIEMPHSNGVEIARRIREADRNCIIIFVTSMAQYAIQGYEVEAFDFIVKPVKYAQLAFKLDRALAAAAQRTKRLITISSGGQLYRLSPDSIFYLESAKHCVTFHTSSGDLTVWHKTMSEIEEELAPFGFARSDASFLVNLRHVTAVTNDTVWIGERAASLSRGKKKTFLAALSKYMG